MSDRANPRDMPPVLVTDGEQRSALAAVRSLGRAGHPVFVCSSRRRSLAGASRYSRAHAQVPDALREPAAFVAAVRELSRRWGIEILIPISEASLLAVLPERESLGVPHLPFPGADQFARICDKALVFHEARAHGIGVPEQTCIDSAGDREQLDSLALRFPLVVKPSRSVSGAAGQRSKLTVSHAASRAELDRVLETIPADAYPLLLQERIIGPGIGVFLLLWEGEPVASFFHRRIREKPPAGGVSVYRESAPPDADLLARSRALLGAFDWQGVAMVEYKVDEVTGRPYLMEINGRFWGSLQLAIDAGIDFPALLVAAALGRVPAPVHTYRTGVRSRWWFGDLDHLLTRLRRSDAELALPPGSSGRIRTSLDFMLTSLTRSRNEVLRLADPAPAAREALDWILRR